MGPKGFAKGSNRQMDLNAGGTKKDKAWNKMTKGLGSIPSIMPPADTKAFVKKQYETFKAVAEKVGLSVN